MSKPTIKDLANQKQVKQKVNGWKMHHIAAQMDNVIDLETELTSRLAKLQMILNKHALSEVKGDVDKTQELIKANLQRSKIIQVSKSNFLQDFNWIFSLIFSFKFLEPSQRY